MLAIHDPVTSQMCDRLETTSIGLGLVRLLQDAMRFEEARTVLYSLEGGIQGVESDKASPNLVMGVSGAASCSSASPNMSDVAEMLTMPSSIA